MRNWRFHHVGVITSNLSETVTFYSDVLAYSVSQTFEDPIQEANIVLLHAPHSPMIEVICPTSPTSPAAGWIKRIQAGPYHTCYQVESLNEVLESLNQRGLNLVFGPAPAVAFQGAPVAFVWGPAVGLMELVEQPIT